MASVRATTAGNRNKVQAITPITRELAALQNTQQTGQESLEAEFSRLVEQIAGQVEVSGEAGSVESFQVAPIEALAKVTRSTKGAESFEQSREKSEQVKKDAFEDRTSVEEPNPNQETSDHAATESERNSNTEEHDAPATETDRKEQIDPETQSEAQPVVGAAIVAAAQASTQGEQKPQVILDEEGSPVPEDEEQDSDPQDGDEGSADAQQLVIETTPEEGVVVTEHVGDARKTNDKEGSTRGRQASPVVASSDTPLAEGVGTQQGQERSLEQSPHEDTVHTLAERQVKIALEQIGKSVSERPEQTSAPIPTALTPKFTVERDSLVASLALRPVLELAQRNVDVAKVINATAPGASQPVLSELSAAKNTVRNGAESSARSAKPGVRVTFEQAMERVEAVVKEVARSRDGNTLTFRLDPPQLGNLKVDVSLRDGGLHARLVPESAQVAQLLRERAHELQVSLRKLGLEVDSISVSVGGEHGSSEGASGKGSFAEQQQAFDARSGRNSMGTSHLGNAAGAVASAPTVAGPNMTDHWVA